MCEVLDRAENKGKEGNCPVIPGHKEEVLNIYKKYAYRC
jgi:hypothetical protein